MPLAIPAEFLPVLAAADSSAVPIQELTLAGALAASLPEGRELTADERRGAFAENGALRFRPAHNEERRHWGTYWCELASWVTTAGKRCTRPTLRMSLTR
jgi:hypothetical protein